MGMNVKLTAPGGTQTTLITLMILALITGAVVWFSPADRVLGDLVKLIYVHGALIRVGVLAFAASGLLGAAFLALPRPGLLDWSQAAARAAIIVWILYWLSSLLSMQLAWGGIAWSEPRFIVTTPVLIAAPAVQVGAWLVGNQRVTAFANALLAGVIILTLSQAHLILHPLDPIGQSSSAQIRAAYYLILLLTALTTWQLTRLLRGSMGSRRAEA